MSQLTNNSTLLNNLLTTVNELPNAITIDTTLTQSGYAADAKATGDAIGLKANASHTQAASTITAGTFTGAVVAQTSSQTPGTSLLRNSKLVTADTNPSYNGEICWTYE